MSNDLLATPPSNDEVANVILNYLTGRASAGVRFAQAVVSVTCRDGVATVIFDPANTGMTDELFRDLSPYDNMAQFVGASIGFNDSVGQWCRQTLVRVDTQMRDGSSLGSMSVAEIRERATV